MKKNIEISSWTLSIIVSGAYLALHEPPFLGLMLNLYISYLWFQTIKPFEQTNHHYLLKLQSILSSQASNYPTFPTIRSPQSFKFNHHFSVHLTIIPIQSPYYITIFKAMKPSYIYRTTKLSIYQPCTHDQNINKTYNNPNFTPFEPYSQTNLSCLRNRLNFNPNKNG